MITKGEIMKSLAGLAALTLCATFAAASEPIPFDSPRWQISAEENRIEEYAQLSELARLVVFERLRSIFFTAAVMP